MTTIGKQLFIEHGNHMYGETYDQMVALASKSTTKEKNYHEIGT